MLDDRRPARLATLLPVIFLACLVCALFLPILRFEFADMDLSDHVLRNPYVHGLTGENVKRILTSRCSSSYYPVRSLTYAVDYEIWGLNPKGFKLTNLLIHLANVLLVFWLVLRLFRRRADGSLDPWWQASVAALSAGVFAVHPVVVEPVTWVPGREELLMTLGALGCIHLHITARRLAERRGRTRAVVACHVGVALCCAAACLSNAVAVVIPLLIVAWDVLTLRPPKLRKILYGTAALWPICAATIVIKKLGYSSELIADEAGVFSLERLVLVSNVYWLNLKALVWPTELAVSYGDSRPASFHIVGAILELMVVGLTCAALWMLRRRKLALLGLVWFGLALGPTSQIMPHHIHRADRFLYLPLAVLAVAVAMGLRPLRYALKSRAAAACAIGAGVSGLALLSIVSAHQVQTWRDRLSVWKQCVSVAPGSTLARRSLADNYVRLKQFDLAIPHYRAAIALDPDNLEALNNYALELATWPDEKLRDYELAIELAQRACEVCQWEDPKPPRTLAIAHNNLAVKLNHSGQFRQAIHHYNKAIRTDPTYAGAYFNLALLRATCGDEKLRRGEEAVRLAEQGCKIMDPPEPNALMILAAAYAEAGQLETAVSTNQRAIEVAKANGDKKLADQLRGPLKRYQKMMQSDSK